VPGDRQGPRGLTGAAQLAAAHAIAGTVRDDRLDAEHIVPSVFDERLVPAVAQAVAGEAGHHG
jgi:malate dehydrogenase (oxaloacetate-decarboxylating)